MLLDYTFKKGDGARDNTNHNIDDLNFKIIRDLTENQALTLRTNYFSEDSQVSYSGITRAEYENFGGQYNPFKNDSFVTKRYGTSVTHDWQVSQNMYLLTNIYYSYFDRDWWRQQSNSAAGNIASGTGCNSVGSARVAGQRINSDDCLGNQGRLRTYETYGIEPSLNINHQLGLLELSMRIHREQQDRRQVNGSSPRARDGTLVEDNYRETNAISGYISNKFDLGKFSITPAVRYEHIENERLNRLNGANGKNILNAWVPGVSVGYTPNDQITYFAGVHKGFAPPRTEDLITNNGGAIDVNAENSTNHEIGLRAKPNSKSYIETTAFYNDFSNLIAVGSVASNLPALAQGEALFAGLEMLGKYDFDSGFYSKAAITWLPIAKQESQFRRVDDNTNVANSMEGKRQPYAPKQTITAGLGFRNNGWDGFFEAVHVGEQFADFAETKNVDDLGQNGVINSYTIFNAAVNYKIPQYKTSLFAVGKNIFDNEYIVDRTRGIITGMPALFQVGARIDF
jgi:Fe(3+) dicitrate transport protein